MKNQTMDEYWNTRAEGYSEINKEELETEIQTVWVNLINEHRPKGESLNILDAGCGPGFLSIIMAKQGHKVTAIDFSVEMIKRAQENAAKNAVDKEIHFVHMDAQKLDFPDNTFDLILSRNITWTLPHPEQAYTEWVRVLKPAGRVLNFDGNWRLHLYHPYLAELNEKLQEDCIKKGWEIEEDGHDKEHAGDLLDCLPLADKIRPYWDINFLKSLRNVNVSALNELPEGVMNAYYTMIYKYTPMFMVKIEKCEI